MMFFFINYFRTGSIGTTVVVEVEVARDLCYMFVRIVLRVKSVPSGAVLYANAN